MSSDDIRYHSSGDMDGLRELAGTTEPVAVVLRPDGSADVYGYVAVIDQRTPLSALPLAVRAPELVLPPIDGEPLTCFFHCWRFPGHHECAVALIERQGHENDRLIAECGALKRGVREALETRPDIVADYLRQHGTPTTITPE